jgi:hypothetical protein
VGQRLLDDASLSLHRGDDGDRSAVEAEFADELGDGHRACAQRVGHPPQQLLKLDVALDPDGTQLLGPGPHGRVEPTVDVFQIVGARPHVAHREHRAYCLEARGLWNERRRDGLAAWRDLIALKERIAQRVDRLLSGLVAGRCPGRESRTIRQVGQVRRRAPDKQQDGAGNERAAAPIADMQARQGGGLLVRSILHAHSQDFEARLGCSVMGPADHARNGHGMSRAGGRGALKNG